jgi:inosine-uridine nucleoside N-ribohydrolase
MYPGKIYNGMEETVSLFSSFDNVTILSLAPMTNIKKIFELSPKLYDQVQVIAMGGSLYKGYLNQEEANPEYNILMDLEAAKYVFKNVKKCVLAPLDVCRDFIIDDKNYQSILISKCSDIQLLIENYKIWDRTYIGGAIKFNVNISSTILYDVVPVIYLLRPNFFIEQEVSFDVLNTGLTSVNKNGEFRLKSLVNWAEEEKKYELVTRIYLGGLFEN